MRNEDCMLFSNTVLRVTTKSTGCRGIRQLTTPPQHPSSLPTNFLTPPPSPQHLNHLQCLFFQHKTANSHYPQNHLCHWTLQFLLPFSCNFFFFVSPKKCLSCFTIRLTYISRWDDNHNYIFHASVWPCLRPDSSRWGWGRNSDLTFSPACAASGWRGTFYCVQHLHSCDFFFLSFFLFFFWLMFFFFYHSFCPVPCTVYACKTWTAQRILNLLALCHMISIQRISHTVSHIRQVYMLDGAWLNAENVSGLP